MFKFIALIFRREAIDAPEIGHGLNSVIRALARLNTRLRPIRDEDTITVTVNFRILVNDIIRADNRWSVSARDDGDTSPGLDARTEIIVMHQIDSIGAAFRAERAFYRVAIIIIEGQRRLECPATASSAIKTLWNGVGIDPVIEQRLEVSIILAIKSLRETACNLSLFIGSLYLTSFLNENNDVPDASGGVIHAHFSRSSTRCRGQRVLA